jgi:hypothetical protein
MGTRGHPVIKKPEFESYYSLLPSVRLRMNRALPPISSTALGHVTSTHQKILHFTEYNACLKAQNSCVIQSEF